MDIYNVIKFQFIYIMYDIYDINFFPLANNPNRIFIYRIQVFLGSFGDISSLILTIVITLMAKYYI